MKPLGGDLHSNRAWEGGKEALSVLLHEKAKGSLIKMWISTIKEVDAQPASSLNWRERSKNIIKCYVSNSQMADAPQVHPR